MLLDQFVNIKWNSKNKKHYTDLGYVYTKMGDEFRVHVKDLTNGSHTDVQVQCDYCNKVYMISYHAYVRSCCDTVDKDCCHLCRKKKIVESLMSRYGVTNPMSAPGAAEKQRNTINDLYGVDNVFTSPVVKEKIANTNLRRYGFKKPNQSIEVIEKRRSTNRERYGFNSHMQAENYREMFSGEKNPRWKVTKSKNSREADRSSDTYRLWRNEVFARDRYICRCCGSRGDWKYGVQAHHISNWSEDIAKRYDIDNGITLCKKCHDEFHRVYGRKHNSKNQIEEFLNQGKKIC